MPLQFLLFSPWGATHVVCAFGGSYIAIDVMSKDEVGVFWGLAGEGVKNAVESFVVCGSDWVVN